MKILNKHKNHITSIFEIEDEKKLNLFLRDI
jgi:hypothetical protein